MVYESFEKAEVDRLTEILINIVRIRNDWIAHRDLDTQDTALSRDTALTEWNQLSAELMGWAFEAGAVFTDIRAAACGEDCPDGCPGLDVKHTNRTAAEWALWEGLFYQTSGVANVILPSQIAEELRYALKALDFGEVRDILRPERRRHVKQGFTLPPLRIEAVLACYYFHGTGLTWASAESKVAVAFNEQPATIRNWKRGKVDGVNVDRISAWEHEIYGALVTGTSVDEALLAFQAPADANAAEVQEIRAFLEGLRANSEYASPAIYNDEHLADLGATYRAEKRRQQKSPR